MSIIVPAVSSGRIRVLADVPPREKGLYVAYSMTSARRGFWNHGLQHAANWSRELGVSLLVCEPIHRTSSSTADSHRFLLDGMRATEQRLSLAGVLYHPYVEPEAGASDGLLAALARRASVLVVDEGADVSGALPSDELRIEAVDGFGLLRRVEHESRPEAHTVRHRLHARLQEVLQDFPARNPLAKFHEHHLQSVLPHITTRWPRASGMLMAGDSGALAELGLPEGTPATAPRAEPDATAKSEAGERSFHREEGGSKAAFHNWRELLVQMVPEGETYGEAEADRRSVDERRRLLSRHLSSGHISRHQIVAETLRRCGWTPASIPSTPTETSLWGLPTQMERLLDEVAIPQ